MYEIILVVFAVFDLMGLVAYGLDKHKASKGKWRIPEKTLLSLAVLGGVGTFLGMSMFRHKTLKTGFVVFNTVFCLLQIVAVSCLFRMGLI